MIDPVLVYILLVLLFASIIRSAFGFGESLIAVPLLALVIPLDVAVPLSVLASVTIAAIVTANDWREIHFKSAKLLLISTLFGLPFGFFILKKLDNSLLNLILGFSLILFSIFSLFRRSLEIQRIEHPSWVHLFGFMAGVLGGAYGMNGPPLVVYGSLKDWKPRNFRATLHAYFLPASILGTIGFWFLGILTREVWHYFFFSLLVIIPATTIGRILNRAISEQVFKRILYLALIFVGLLLVFSDAPAI